MLCGLGLCGPHSGPQGSLLREPVGWLLAFQGLGAASFHQTPAAPHRTPSPGTFCPHPCVLGQGLQTEKHAAKALGAEAEDGHSQKAGVITCHRAPVPPW